MPSVEDVSKEPTQSEERPPAESQSQTTEFQTAPQQPQEYNSLPTTTTTTTITAAPVTFTNKRRTFTTQKSRSKADIQRTVSLLLDDPNAPQSIDLDSSDDEEEENQDGGEQAESQPSNFSKRRKVTVIDRAAVKRASTSMNEHGNTKLAFQTSASVDAGVFKVPSLLRRATTQVTAAYDGGQSSGGGAGGSQGVEGGNNNNHKQSMSVSGIKKGGTASSSINFYQREANRKKVVQGGSRVKKMEERKMLGERRQRMQGILGVDGFSQ